jgi:hypothetical protein
MNKLDGRRTFRFQAQFMSAYREPKLVTSDAPRRQTWLHLEAELKRVRKQHEAEVREPREDMLEAQGQIDNRSQEESTANPADLQKKMDQDREDRERMSVTMEQLQKERDAELREERQKNYE